jgi:hypothetical protein
MDIRETFFIENGVGSSGSGPGPILGYCERRNEPSYSTEFFTTCAIISFSRSWLLC